MNEAHPWRSWFEAVHHSPIHQSLRGIYQELEREVAALKPTCWLSGKCCKFETYGHKLYITGLEVAYALAQLDPPMRAFLDAADLPQMDGCPFQVKGLCGIHALRPLGCRVYFCDPSAQHWQSDVYERYLAKLRALHGLHALEYRYLEWRAALAEARDFLAAAPSLDLTGRPESRKT